MTKYILIVHMC